MKIKSEFSTLLFSLSLFLLITGCVTDSTIDVDDVTFQNDLSSWTIVAKSFDSKLSICTAKEFVDKEYKPIFQMKGVGLNLIRTAFVLQDENNILVEEPNGAFFQIDREGNITKNSIPEIPSAASISYQRELNRLSFFNYRVFSLLYLDSLELHEVRKITYRKVEGLSYSSYSDTVHSWSPDYKNVVYCIDGKDLYIHNFESGNNKFLVSGIEPLWIPETAKIVYRSDPSKKPRSRESKYYNICQINSDGSNNEVLISEKELKSWTREIFTIYSWSGVLTNLFCSPDGKYLVFGVITGEGHSGYNYVFFDLATRKFYITGSGFNYKILQTLALTEAP